MIETILKNYIETQLYNVSVYMEQPETPPDKYVILRMIDIGKVNQIDAATFEVTVRANTMYQTAILRDQVKSALLNAITLSNISSAELGGGSMQVESANHVYQAQLICNYYFYD